MMNISINLCERRKFLIIRHRRYGKLPPLLRVNYWFHVIVDGSVKATKAIKSLALLWHAA